MILLNNDSTKPKPIPSVRGNWSSYIREKLCELLTDTKWSIDDDLVQGCWNSPESKLINIVCKAAPLSEFRNNNLNNSLQYQPKLGIKLR
jgi:hypothetical protein